VHLFALLLYKKTLKHCGDHCHILIDNNDLADFYLVRLYMSRIFTNCKKSRSEVFNH